MCLFLDGATSAESDKAKSYLSGTDTSGEFISALGENRVGLFSTRRVGPFIYMQADFAEPGPVMLNEVVCSPVHDRRRSGKDPATQTAAQRACSDVNRNAATPFVCPRRTAAHAKRARRGRHPRLLLVFWGVFFSHHMPTKGLILWLFTNGNCACSAPNVCTSSVGRE